MTMIARDDADLSSDTEAIEQLYGLVAAQKKAHRADPYPTLQRRIELINATAAMVLAHRREIKDALHADFGWHPEPVADLIEILGVAVRAQYVAENLPTWMADERREIDRGLWGSASATVRWRPKGVIGNMVPWNFPFDIAFGPLIDMLAAGNRVVLKPSDLGPASAELMASMVAGTFDPDQVAVSVGGFELARTFPTLAWDHLMFTGSPAVGKAVMRAAAENLVPVTLELGGKSPAIVTADAVDETTVRNLVGMKLLKSGQVCVAPDHVLVPRGQLEEFVALVQRHVADELPAHTSSPDTTGMINLRHLDRVEALVRQAQDAGYQVIRPEAGATTDRDGRRMPLTLVLDPGPELDLMREEIFGPVLPVVPYDDLDDVIEQLNAGERPLALYVYTRDEAVADEVIGRTDSGGACVNTAVLHGAIAQLPFGGVGNSGMGRHHSIESFHEFSYPRGVLVRGSEPDAVDAFNPPYRTLHDMVTQVYAQIDAQIDAGASEEPS